MSREHGHHRSRKESPPRGRPHPTGSRQRDPNRGHHQRDADHRGWNQRTSDVDETKKFVYPPRPEGNGEYWGGLKEAYYRIFPDGPLMRNGRLRTATDDEIVTYFAQRDETKKRALTTRAADRKT